ncbi:hypothetical protein RM780_18900 [Streptomyces sp. DSM 44917]|uniref:Uncharacterized protein n=1 Tax=Streptomyces boetiae TaxID=3075541 RepID=A0ABU2LBX3_9ACTN|nr:hypothetical protein [Streptomyces sp. DSM 44917]MDT0309012.1 hypothetical protein [Streptomyces sp. DSM 44917]
MIRTESVGRVVRRAAPPHLARWTARHRGRRDGLAGIPHVPPQGQVESPETPFVREQHATARRAAEQLRSRLLDREWRLVADLRYQAVQVVAQYDVRGREAPAGLAKFGARVGEWRAKADVCRYRARAVTEHANQQLARYWDEVRRHHRDLPDPAPAYLAGWGPARVELDPSWADPDLWLSAPTGGPEAEAPPGASAIHRALYLLDNQGRRPAATSGAAPGPGGRR